MNNLQPLKWTQKNLNPLAELELTAYSALHEYVITEPKQSRFELKKTRLSRPDKKSEFLENFDTVKEAKDWAWAHYQRSMQPYVKPLPTWIDVSERLPDKSGRYMVVHQTIKCVKNKPALVDIDSYDENEKAWIFFRSGIMQEVTHWMPIPEFSTMQILHKGE